MLSLPRKIEGKTIIISPLNWGLGHASRIVPLIEWLHKRNTLIIAGEQPSLSFLQSRFPQIKHVETGKTNFHFSPDFFSIKNLIKFYGHLRQTIETDKILADKLAGEHAADIIISDNRYGFRSHKTLNILITHQLTLKTPWGKLFDPLTRLMVFSLVKPFDEIWIPDSPQLHLSGRLGKNYLGPKAKYIGLLSRFCKTSPLKQTAYKYDFCVIISGPEPSRSIVEKQIINFLERKNARSIILAGNTTSSISFDTHNIEYRSMADDATLLQVIQNSETIITTAGYSTIMDMYCLHKKVVLIPTPHQTEQEYLAHYLSRKYPERYSYFSISELTTKIW